VLKNAIISFKPAVNTIYKDKTNLLFASAPVAIGLMLYYFLGTFVYGSVMNQAQVYINKFISAGAVGDVLYTIVMAILTVMLYFMISWTFVLVVSLVASPFNDILSARIEKQLDGQKLDSLPASFKVMMANFTKTIFVELKKISLIIFLSVIAFIIGFLPVLVPVSILITVILLAAQFIDYSWARNNIGFKSCVKDLTKNGLGYTLGGGFFFILVSIPIVNLLVPSLATSYFTILWVKNNKKSEV